MSRYIELTHPIMEEMPVFPGDPRPEIKETMSLGKDPCTVQSLRFRNHLGTHLDAPSHFIREGKSIDEIPLETLMGKARVLDFTEKGKNTLISKEDLEQRLEGIAEEASRVLLKTGWDQNFISQGFYEGFPSLTLEAAQYLASKQIILLGMDTPSPSPLDDPDQMIHKTLLGAGVVLLESLKNLTTIDKEEFFLAALPPPFKGLSGSPCRAVAIL